LPRFFKKTFFAIRIHRFCKCSNRMGVFVLRKLALRQFSSEYVRRVERVISVFLNNIRPALRCLMCTTFTIFTRKAGESWLAIQSMCHFLAVLVLKKQQPMLDISFIYYY
jgi:hypothetical protein